MSIFLIQLVLHATLLQSAAAQSQPAPAQARATIRQAQLAVEGDSVARVRTRWLRASSDPLAALGLATLARLNYAYPEAQSRYAVLERQPAVGAYALLGRGLMHTTRWQVDSASLMLKRALELARATRDPMAEAEGLWALSRIYSRVVSTDSAMRMLMRAETLVPAQEKALLADVRCFTGRLTAARNAQFADSAVAAAVTLARESGNLRVLGRCLHVHATVLEIRGLQRQASRVAHLAVETLDRARDFDAGASALQFRAYHDIAYSFEFGTARSGLDSAIARGQRSGNRLAVAWSQLNLGQLAQRLGDVRAAARLTAASSEMFARLGDRFGLGAAALLQADAAFLAGRTGDAERGYARADSLQSALGNAGARALILMKMSGVFRERGRLQEAQSALDESVRIATAMNFGGLAHTDQYYERGMLSLTRGQHAQALREFETFLQRLGGNALHYHYDAQSRAAEALTGMGRLSAADSLLVRVEQMAGALREAGSEREAQVALLDSRRFDFDTDLGFATIIQRFAAAGQQETALRIAEDRRARYLWTAMMRRHVLRDSSAQNRDARNARMMLNSRLDARSLLNLLPDSTALLEYVTGRGGEPTTLFILTRRGINAHQLPAADSLVDDIATFIAALEAGSPAHAAARKLGNTLLAPALPYLQGVQRLVVVPDGPIYRVPFDALELTDGQPALLRFTLSLAPSARIAAANWQNRTVRSGGTLLALGDPAFDRSAGLARLPGSGSEAKAVARGVTGARALLGKRASEAALKRADLRGVRVLHLATHAEVEDFGLLRSALALAPGDGEDGQVGVTEIAALDLPADLVVLSGCRTAGGVVVTGEGVQGLVAPFLEAGARSVVATQWAVGDRSMVELITRFYRELRTGERVDDALRTAKLVAYQAGRPPSLWAALAVTGDGQVRPLAPLSASR